MNKKYLRRRSIKKLFNKFLLGCMCSCLPCVSGSEAKNDEQARQAWERLRQTDFNTIATRPDFCTIKKHLQSMAVAPAVDVPDSAVQPTTLLGKHPFFSAYKLLEILSSRQESALETLVKEGWEPSVFVGLDAILRTYVVQDSFFLVAFGINIKTNGSSMDSVHAVLDKVLKGYIAIYDKEKEAEKEYERQIAREKKAKRKRKNPFSLFKKKQ